MESGTGKYDCFPCILLLKRKGGPSEEGSPLPTPRKKKKASNNCWCLSLLVVVSSSFCMGMHMIWPLIMPLVLIFAHFVFSITQFPDRKKEKKKRGENSREKNKDNYFKVYGILELRMKYHPPKTMTEFEKEFLCTQ